MVAPFDIEDFVWVTAGEEGKDAVACQVAILIDLEGGDWVSKPGIRQAARVEVIGESGEVHVAVEAGCYRVVGVAVEADRKEQGPVRDAVSGVLVPVGRARH